MIMRPTIVLLALLLTTSIAAADYGAPLALPGAETAADPAVIEVDGTYYLYVTSSYVDIECWASEDLVQWRYEGVAWAQAPAGAWNDQDVWAPEVHTDGESFYLYYAANMMIGVARADAPTGPFSDVYDHPFVGGGYGGVNGLAIDAHVFRDDDDRLYFYFAGYQPFSVVRVARMSDMVTIDGEPATLVKPGIVNWELFVTEAPWIVKHDGVYYLMYSGYGADRVNYAVGYATADDPLGPFAEYADNPILYKDVVAGFYGPGHNGTLVDPDGALQIVYHTKVAPTIGWDRQIRINQLCFTAAGRMYVGFDGCTQTDEDDDDTVDDDAADDDVAPVDDDEDDEDDDDGCGC